MHEQRRLTGWELEGHITRLLQEGPPGQSYCVLCVAETLGQASAAVYLDVAKAIRRVGAYQPQTYATAPGTCAKHTSPSGPMTLWTIRKRPGTGR